MGNKSRERRFAATVRPARQGNISRGSIPAVSTFWLSRAALEVSFGRNDFFLPCATIFVQRKRLPEPPGRRASPSSFGTRSPIFQAAEIGTTAMTSR
jgi:hypothetical protein